MKNFKQFLTETTSFSEEEKAAKRAEHILQHGPKILFELITKQNRIMFDALKPEEQEFFRTRHAIAREVYHDKKFMGSVYAHRDPKKEKEKIATEIGRRGDIGLDDAAIAAKAHEFAIMSVPEELK